MFLEDLLFIKWQSREILKESAHQMNKCVVVVTHSNELAKQADVVFRLKKGELHIEQSGKSS